MSIILNTLHLLAHWNMGAVRQNTAYFLCSFLEKAQDFIKQNKYANSVEKASYISVILDPT